MPVSSYRRDARKATVPSRSKQVIASYRFDDETAAKLEALRLRRSEDGVVESRTAVLVRAIHALYEKEIA